MTGFDAFLHSSLSCAGADVISSSIQRFAADTVAHIGIAGILTAFILYRGWPIGLFWAGLAAIVAKEIAFDLPNAGFAPIVLFDSAWDVTSWFLGFFAHWWLFLNASVSNPDGGEIT